MTLNSDGSASITQDEVIDTNATWSVSSVGRITIIWNNGASSMQGYYSIQNGTLLIMDLDDPSIFNKL